MIQGQKIVEVVRHATREPPDGLHLLRLTQLGGELRLLLARALAVADVKADANGAHDLARRSAQRPDLVLERAPQAEVLIRARDAGQRPQVAHQGLVAGFARAPQIVQAHAHHLPGPQVQVAQPAARGRGEHQLTIHRVTEAGHALEHGRQALLVVVCLIAGHARVQTRQLGLRRGQQR
jgi:hypothetical protein